MNKRLSVSWIFALVCLVLLTAGLATAAAQAGEDTQELKALYEEGKNLWFGINGKDYDREAAIDCFRRAAEAGYADAWYYLGNTTLTGTDPGRYTAAMEQYRKAEELGSLLALYGEARLYHYGRGTELNREKAKELYEKAIAGGCVEAYEGLSALMLDDVDGQDVDKAIQYGEKALEGEDFQIVCRAMISISQAYRDGTGEKKDLEKAFEWTKKCADAGYNAGYGNLGWRYYHGEGVEQSDEKALACFEKGAEKGDCNELAWCYLNGKLVKRDYAKAMELYTRGLNSSVVSLGSGANTSFYNIGWMYQYGKGVKQDYAAALEWYRKGIEDGDPDCMIDAAELYLSGKGTAKDPDRALELYEQAKKNAPARTYSALGDLYKNGKAVPKDFEKAIENYEKGAELGSAYCFGELGWLYAYGMKNAKDYEKARMYYEKGAQLDSPYCYERLGVIYNEGLGVEKDPEKAVELLQTAVQKAVQEDNQTILKRSLKILGKLRRTVTQLALSQKRLTLMTGGPEEAAKASLSCEVTPEKALWKEVTWSSSDESIVTVDESGTVKAVAPGKATVTATTTQPLGTVSAEAQVTVLRAVSGIELDPAEVSVPVKKTAAVKAAVSPADAGSKKVTWTSQNEEIAKVSANGQITGKSAGVTTVTATAADGSGVSASLKVTVIQPVTKITASEKTVALEVGQEHPLTVQVLPEDASDPTVVWSSDNEAVATVSESGKITATGTGKCVVTGAAGDGSRAKVQVSVRVK